MTSDLDYRAIRKRVEAGITKQKFRTRAVLFAVSLFIYVLFMLIGWGMFLSAGGQNVPLVDAQGDNILVGAMVMLSTAGGMGVLFQFISLALDSKQSEERIRERLVAREINREMMQMGLDEVEEHEKRKGMMRLTDDGELEELVEEPANLSEEMPLKRQR